MEPKNQPSEPINDELTKFMELALKKAKEGAANYSDKDTNPEIHFNEKDAWRGYHTCFCGERSRNHDYLLKNGMITNSLCVHYVMCHRSKINKNDIKKLDELVKFYKK
jgi:hypothetical protein